MLWTDRAQTLPCPEAVQRHGCNHTCPSNPPSSSWEEEAQIRQQLQLSNWLNTGIQSYTATKGIRGSQQGRETCFSQLEVELMTEPWIAMHTCGPHEQTKSLNLPWLKLYPAVKQKPQITLIWYEMSLCPPQRSKWIFHSMLWVPFAQTSHHYAWYWNICIKMLPSLIHTFCFSV